MEQRSPTLRNFPANWVPDLRSFFLTATLPPNRGMWEVDARRSLRLGGLRRLIAEDGVVVFLQ